MKLALLLLTFALFTQQSSDETVFPGKVFLGLKHSGDEIIGEPLEPPAFSFRIEKGDYSGDGIYTCQQISGHRVSNGTQYPFLAFACSDKPDPKPEDYTLRLALTGGDFRSQ